MTVTLDDGSVLVEEMAFPPGHDKNPLDDAGLATKIHRLTDPVCGRAARRRFGAEAPIRKPHDTAHGQRVVGFVKLRVRENTGDWRAVCRRSRSLSFSSWIESKRPWA